MDLLKLNLGGGDLAHPGFINIDLRGEIADIVADVRHLPLPDSSVTHIIAFDLLEHFPATETSTLLTEWNRVLVPGGELRLKIPNLLVIAQLIAGGDRRTPALIRNIYGGHRWGPDGAWDTHHTGWTPDLICDTLSQHHFMVMESDMEINMTIVSVKL